MQAQLMGLPAGRRVRRACGWHWARSRSGWSSSAATCSSSPSARTLRGTACPGAIPPAACAACECRHALLRGAKERGNQGCGWGVCRLTCSVLQSHDGLCALVQCGAEMRAPGRRPPEDPVWGGVTLLYLTFTLHAPQVEVVTSLTCSSAGHRHCQKSNSQANIGCVVLWQARASRLSFGDIVKRLAATDEASPTFISNKVLPQSFPALLLTTV